MNTFLTEFKLSNSCQFAMKILALAGFRLVIVVDAMVLVFVLAS